MKRTNAATDLLRLIGGMAQERVDALPDWIQRGRVGADMALTVGRLTFPAGSWRRNELFTLPDPIETTSAASVGDHGSHSHSIPRPEQFRPLAPGDAVVVGLYLDNTEPIVFCRDVGS